MILEDAQVPDVIWTGLQWVLSAIAIAILCFFLFRWVLKKSFPTLRKVFYFLVPTYIIGAILVVAIGNEQLNQYTLFEFDNFVFFLCPPLVWDAMFAMGIDQNKISLVLVSLFFIVFLPIWVAMKTSAGNNESEKKYAFVRRLVSAWVIVTIMGMGMANFYTYIFTWMTTYSFLGIAVIFWILIITVVFIVMYYLYKRRKKDKGEGGCQIIDGEWVCPYGQKPPQ